MSYHLKIKINNNDPELYSKYFDSVKKFCEDECEDFRDSGFDLFMPEDVTIFSGSLSNKISHDVICYVYKLTKISGFSKKHLLPCPYYMYPRSSIGKTPLRMSNSVGIIDSGYRGPLIAMVDNVDNNHTYTIHKYDRLFQICSPDLTPFDSVEIVHELPEKTMRGDGGFGSTGR